MIGNADYKVGPLENPLKDAAAVAKVLEALQFDKVILKQNLSAEGFRAALLEMSRESAGAELGVVYFAGHGTEVAGRNFLIPIDAVLAKAGDLDLQAIALDTVLNQLAGVTKLKLVILDACRNNLFPMAGAKRSVGRGLSSIEPEGNTLVAYAAKHGTTADDGPGGKHSPFTEALLKHIATPGLEIRLLFGRVRDEVIELTRHEAEPQQPHIYGTLGGTAHYLSRATPGSDNPEAQRRLDGEMLARDEELSKTREELRAAREAFKKSEERRLAALTLAETVAERAVTEKREADKKVDSGKVAALQKPNIGGAFDGTWRLYRSGPGCIGLPATALVIHVANGVVSGRVAVGQITGTVSATGQLRLSHPSRFPNTSTVDGFRLTHQGSLIGNRGSGTFRHTRPNSRCSGTFTATRG